jgi:alkylhydroperoxidase family enzyme
MPRIDVPEGLDPMMHVWATLAPAIAAPAAAYSDAVYHQSSLPLRVIEAARIRIAHINDCTVCRGWRTARDNPERGDAPDAVPEEFYEHVFDPSWDGYSERERLAIEFAERFAVDHLSMDDAFWDRMHASYTDDEIVELTLSVGAWLALGRLNRVLEIDGACRLDSTSMHGAIAAARER